MLVKCGSVAYSPFRVNGLVNSMNTTLNSSAIVALRSVWVHYIEPRAGSSLANGTPSAEVTDALDKILEYDSPLPLDDPLNVALLAAIDPDTYGSDAEATALPESCYIIHVAPRPGTVSPWSSKATNILHNCELSGEVERVERGFSILIKVRKSFPFDSYLSQHAFLDLIHDRMTQVAQITPIVSDQLFKHSDPKPLVSVPRSGIAEANKNMGLALDGAEVDYLNQAFPHRDPTDLELFMFAQVNSEHCRHKIFNADWNIDGEAKEKSLFKHIRATNDANPDYTISAYSDNAAVMKGASEAFFFAPNSEGVYSLKPEAVAYLAKVETHNHPTAISPFPGAATGSGGEIRDEGAVGRGSKPKAGLSGFAVSDLHIPEFTQPWENEVGKPSHVASALSIMLEAPIGSAAFNNEFGRPAINGYFRTLTTDVPTAESSSKTEIRGYHKPIMLAGGVGSVRPPHALKDRRIPPGALLIVLGGPAMLIGLGGGAASSVGGGDGSAELDFASVQRGNPEMQRRAQMVLDACTAQGDENPIISVHDVGAGGLSNAFTELVHDNDLGGVFEIRNVPCIDKSMSPMEIWCCEAQERYVLAIAPEDLPAFTELCERERAIFGVIGQATLERRLVITDNLLGGKPCDLDMAVLFGKPPRLSRSDVTKVPTFSPVVIDDSFANALDRVLAIPAVGSKSFLITIGDRSVTGLVARDQMVGPWQVPVADVAVTLSSHGADVVTGEAFAIGERPTIAIVDAAAASRVAVTESLLNLAAADIRGVEQVRLSANWMASPNYEHDGSALYRAVQALSEFCIPLGVSVPVGKDSMSMTMRWDRKQVTAPVSVVVTAFGAVANVNKTWTPQLIRDESANVVFVSVKPAHAEGNRLGASSVAQAYQQVGSSVPDVDGNRLLSLLRAIQELHQTEVVAAYHDVSDGGLITTLLEMAFAGRVGLDIKTSDDGFNLFSEDVGAAFQVTDMAQFQLIMSRHGLDFVEVARVSLQKEQPITVSAATGIILNSTRAKLQSRWAETSYKMQRLRDNPKCADQEFLNISDNADPGLSYKLTFDTNELSAAAEEGTARPRVAILREQGVNGHVEMAYAFRCAGFDPVDVHMSDLIRGKHHLRDFHGLAACGGFSYGDVLGAGNGWASSVLFHPELKAMFTDFFAREDTFALGVCNGCQFFSRLREIIPGCADLWPTFERNASEQYEARTALLEIGEEESSEVASSMLFTELGGSRVPISVAHGEGCATFTDDEHMARFFAAKLVVARYVDNYGKVTERYPFNPNGSPQGVAAIKSPNGRVLAMMPHPERNVIAAANSVRPPTEQNGPWLRLFQNARRWLAETHNL